MASKILFVLGAIFLFSFPSITHAAWFEDDVGTSSGTVYSVFFDGSTGYVSGRSGFVAKTTDYGKTWTDISISVTENVYAVAGYGNNAIAVTSGGDLYLYDVSLNEWSTWYAGSVSLNDVAFYSDDVYMVGSSGVIVQTLDFGNTFSTVTTGTTATLNSIKGSDGYVWVVGSNGKVFRKTPSSSSWSGVSSGTSNTLYGVDVEVSGSTVTGWICGSSHTIKKTTNNGSSWTSYTITGVSSSATCYDLDVSGDNIVVAMSTGFYRSDDGGTTWETQDTPSDVGTVFYDVKYGSALSHVAGSGGLFVDDQYSPYAPSNFDNAEGSVTSDTSIDLSWTAGSDTHSDLSYRLSMTDMYAAQTGLTLSGTTTSYTWPEALDDGSYTFSIHSVDESEGESPDVTVSVMVENADPTVIVSASATGEVGVEYAVSATAGDANGIESCELDVPGYGPTDMTFQVLLINWTASFIPLSSGGVTMTVTCTDGAGTEGSSTAYVIFSGSSTVGVEDTQEEATEEGDEEVIESEDADESTGSAEEDIAEEVEEEGTVYLDESSEEVAEAQAGTLIKLACVGETGVNDSCRAVYFYAGADEKRHAFPNEKVFFTWYANFDDVVVVSAEFMSSLSLGGNITYHPGTRMVKFQTVRTVYVVERYGVLRAIVSEDVAQSLYGSDWNQQIDDISDAFWGNYSFGEDVDSDEDYDSEEEEDSVRDLDENLQE